MLPEDISAVLGLEPTTFTSQVKPLNQPSWLHLTYICRQPKSWRGINLNRIRGKYLLHERCSRAKIAEPPSSLIFPTPNRWMDHLVPDLHLTSRALMRIPCYLHLCIHSLGKCSRHVGVRTIPQKCVIEQPKMAKTHFYTFFLSIRPGEEYHCNSAQEW